MTFTDVAVVGAGPAGAWTAYRLSAAGARVTLFDPSHPREKPCGGGVTGRALDLVKAVVPATSLHGVSVRRARFVSVLNGAPASSNASDASVELSSNALAVFSRTTFDNRLLAAAEHAGATLVPERVSAVMKHDRGFQVVTARGTRHEASFIVGADGANSLVRRRMSSALPRTELSIATGYFVRGVTSDEIVLEFAVDPPGYLWSFPRPDHLAIGICAQADAGMSADRLRERVAQWIATTGLGRGERVPYSWPIPSLSASAAASVPIAGEGWLLVGDAAGFVDPITREGIYYALVSAECAAHAVIAGRDVHADYERRVRDLRDELKRAASLKRLFYRRAFLELLLSALASSTGIRSVMADLIAGIQPYRDLKWRLAATREAGLAWRLARSLAAASLIPVGSSSGRC